jgi:hypothetical protein
MTYRVEVSAPTINELAGKLAALASQLKGLPSTFDVLRVEASEINLPAPAPEVKAEPTPEPAPKPEPDARVYDYKPEVAPLVLKMVAAKSRDDVRELLATFGVKSASELYPSRYGELVDAVNKAMGN